MAYQVLYNVFRGISIFLLMIRYIVLAYCVMSWFVRPTNQLYVTVRNIVWPFLAPFRPIASRLFNMGLRLDVTPLLAFLALDLAERLLWWLFALIR